MTVLLIGMIVGSGVTQATPAGSIRLIAGSKSIS